MFAQDHLTIVHIYKNNDIRRKCVGLWVFLQVHFFTCYQNHIVMYP